MDARLANVNALVGRRPAGRHGSVEVHRRTADRRQNGLGPLFIVGHAGAQDGQTTSGLIDGRDSGRGVPPEEAGTEERPLAVGDVHVTALSRIGVGHGLADAGTMKGAIAPFEPDHGAGARRLVPL